MKKLLFGLMVFLGIIPLFAFSDSEGYYSYSYARLNYVRGDVYVQRGQDLGYEQGEVNLPLSDGDKLGTKDGQAEIHFGRRNYLRVAEDTQVDFVSLPRRSGDPVKLHLLAGSLFLRINTLEREKDFEVHTPDASFYVLEVSLIRVNVRENGETELLVYEGAVEAAGERGSLLVEGGDRLLASNGNFVSGPSSVGFRDDEFSRWNESRDTVLALKNSNRYLPSELYEFEDELNGSGRWIYEQPYGYVWVPRVTYVDWRPYCYGRWLWFPIIGWTWISSEPWGWCTYHYGRWHWRFGLGWYWIPTTVWGPAWVHWYWDYDYCGWSPLSWWNRPVVIINNNFYGNYHDHYYPVGSRALTMIHRSQLQAPHVYRNAISPDRLSHLNRISLQARQPDIRPALNRNVQTSVAERVLSRSGVREVKRSFSPGQRAVSPSLLRSPGSTIIERGIRSPAGDPLRKTTSGIVSPSRVERESVAKPVTSSPLRSRFESAFKTYPSRSSSSPSFSSSRSTGAYISRPSTSSSAISRSAPSSSGIKSYGSRLLSSFSSRSDSSSTTERNRSDSMSSILSRILHRDSPLSDERSSSIHSRFEERSVRESPFSGSFSGRDDYRAPSYSRPSSSSFRSSISSFFSPHRSSSSTSSPSRSFSSSSHRPSLSSFSRSHSSSSSSRSFSSSSRSVTSHSIRKK